MLTHFVSHCQAHKHFLTQFNQDQSSEYPKKDLEWSMSITSSILYICEQEEKLVQKKIHSLGQYLKR